jgi:hypothetical protein
MLHIQNLNREKQIYENTLLLRAAEGARFTGC